MTLDLSLEDRIYPAYFVPIPISFAPRTLLAWHVKFARHDWTLGRNHARLPACACFTSGNRRVTANNRRAFLLWDHDHVQMPSLGLFELRGIGVGIGIMGPSPRALW